MDQQLISIFEQTSDSPEIYQTMRDFVSLAGVFSELGNAKTFESPLEILVFLRIIQFFNREALGLDQQIDDAETIYYRYIDVYDDVDPPTKKRVNQYVNILIKYNWVATQGNRLKMRNVGKRMMAALIRAANDSLAYYMQDDIGRSLFQARRDAEISEAYDDYGISGGHIVVSMIRHLDDAIELLKERELELLADRDALPQLELIHALMKELNEKIQERLKSLPTIEAGLIMEDLIHKSTESLSEGTSLSLGMINKYFKFISMQTTDIGSSISPEKTRQFIEKMFNPPVESDIPNAHQIFSFMEQNIYEDESLDGMWVPIKMAPYLNSGSIDQGIYFIENYEPYVDEDIEADEFVEYHAEMIESSEIEEVFKEALWRITKSNIKTETIEKYLENKQEAELEELIIESTSESFGDAVRALMATSALVANRKVDMKSSNVSKTYEKEWEWIKDGDRRYKVRERESK